MSGVSIQKQTFRMARFGENSRLPDLHNVAYVHSSVEWDDSLTSADTRYMRYGRVSGILPYLDQNGYDRERRAVSRDTVVLENERVRAEFLPWMGGRMWSLRVDGREMLSKNPVVQPCNLALRNAWCSGGVEWNVSVRGHNPLTCETLFTELLRLPDGTAGVRFYEYERLRGVAYRLEAYLPPQSAFLFVGVHIENPPGNGETPMYWWSNIAVPEEKGTRIIAPAKEAILSLYDAGKYRMLRRDVPIYEDMDLSRPCDIGRSVDVFFDIAGGRRPFIAALEGDHVGLVQCSTARQLGRKLFVWGMGQGGRHWQRFLSCGDTRYVEIQAGIARTQQEHLPMPEGADWAWLEAYGSLRCDVDGLAYADAAEQCARALDLALPYDALNKEYRGRGAQMAEAAGEIAVYGSGWGALENERRARVGLPPVSRVCRFPADSLGQEQAQWLELLREGSMKGGETSGFPASYMIAAPWKKLLEGANAAHESAAASYHLGVCEHCAGDAGRARALFERSLSLRKSAAAHRALARLDMLAGRGESCLAHYRSALPLAEGVFELSLEYAQTLLALGEYAALLAFIEGLPADQINVPRVLYLQASALVETGRYDEAERILLRPLVIPDMREGEMSLCELWFRLYTRKEGLTRSEAEAKHPLPFELDFRMH